jgi:hypothetical protein
MEIERNKILKNVHMLSPPKRFMEEYCTILVKMAFDSPTKTKAVAKLQLLTHVEVMLCLLCIFPLFELVDSLIKFS